MAIADNSRVALFPLPARARRCVILLGFHPVTVQAEFCICCVQGGDHSPSGFADLLFPFSAPPRLSVVTQKPYKKMRTNPMRTQRSHSLLPYPPQSVPGSVSGLQRHNKSRV